MRGDRKYPACIAFVTLAVMCLASGRLQGQSRSIATQVVQFGVKGPKTYGSFASESPIAKPRKVTVLVSTSAETSSSHLDNLPQPELVLQHSESPDAGTSHDGKSFHIDVRNLVESHMGSPLSGFPRVITVTD